MAADPNAFEYFKQGEPLPALKGASSTTSFDYFKQGEPFPALITVAAAAASDSVRPALVVTPAFPAHMEV